MKEKTNLLKVEEGDLVRGLFSEFIGKKLIVKYRKSERYIFAIRVSDMGQKTSPTYEFQEFELEVVEKGYEQRIDRNKKIDELLK
jgi:hypothetical protein